MKSKSTDVLLGMFVFLLITCLTLGAAEFVSDWWIQHRADALQRARRIMSIDTVRGWRQTPNLNTIFENKTLRTDAQGFRLARAHSAAPTILVLGPSSAFGWGVEADETWPEILGQRFSTHGDRVLNASEVGYTIVQGSLLYESLNKALLSSVHTVVLAYGVNEVDRFRFFGRDSADDIEYFSRPIEPSFGEIFFNSLPFTALLWRGAQEAQTIFGCGFKRAPALRVSMAKFPSVLREFISRLRRDGRRVVYVNSAREIPVTPDETRAALSDRLFLESETLSKAGDCKGSRQAFAQARENEPWRVLRDIDRVNILISELGRELDIPVVDIASALVSPTKGEFFVDPIHPSATGHRLAADQIEAALNHERENGRYKKNQHD